MNNMKNTFTAKRIIAIISLIAIAVLLIAFVISAFFATPEQNSLFFALFFGIIAIPILAWVLLFCYGRFFQKHTMAELFPEQPEDKKQDSTIE